MMPNPDQIIAGMTFAVWLMRRSQGIGPTLSEWEREFLEKIVDMVKWSEKQIDKETENVS